MTEKRRKRRKRKFEMEGVAKFLSEMLTIAWIPRTGWSRIGVDPKETETVSDHQALVNKIAFILAILMKADLGKVLQLVAFHDVPEARTGDFHLIAKRYVDSSGVAAKALQDQVEKLPESIGQKILDLAAEEEKGESLEALVAREADKIATAIRAKEYAERGYNARAWLKSALKEVRTKEAKKILHAVWRIGNFTNCWWEPQLLEEAGE